MANGPAAQAVDDEWDYQPAPKAAPKAAPVAGAGGGDEWDYSPAPAAAAPTYPSAGPGRGGMSRPSGVSTTPPKRGLVGGLMDEAVSQAEGIYHELSSPSSYLENLDPTGTVKKVAQLPQLAQQYEQQKKAGYSLPYRLGTGLMDLVGVSTGHQGEEKAAAAGDTGAVLGHAIVPAAEAVSPLAGEAIGKGISHAAPSILRNPEGEIAVSPTKILERVVPQRPEVLARQAEEARNTELTQKGEDLIRRQKEQDALDKKSNAGVRENDPLHIAVREGLASRLPTRLPIDQQPNAIGQRITAAREEMYNDLGESRVRRGAEQERLDQAHAQRLQETEDARQKELTDQARLREQHAESITQRGKEQGQLDQAHEDRLSQVEKDRQKQLADAERFKLQHAQSLMNRGPEPSGGAGGGPGEEGEIGATDVEREIQTAMNKLVVSPEEQSMVERYLGPEARKLPGEGIQKWRARVTGLLKASRSRTNDTYQF